MIVPIPTMLSFTFRRVLSHPGVFSVAQRLPTRVISSNQSFAVAGAVQRNLMTTTSDLKSDSTADPEPVPESKPKSTRRKTGSSTETAGKDKKGGTKKAETKPKAMHHSFLTRVHAFMIHLDSQSQFQRFATQGSWQCLCSMVP